VHNLTFAYNPARPIFQDFNWTVGKGEAWSVIGPSGCGKTTLLYLIAGLRRPQAGSVTIDGTPLLRPRLATGLILQDYGLLPWATAWENVMLGMRIRGVSRDRSAERARYWMERLGIAEVARQYPPQLSGGQRQRVAIARTLALQPDLLLMDEPFSSLDALTREELQNLVLGLGLEGSITTILVTHSIEEAVLMGRKVLILSRPPILSGQVVENPGGGEAGYREDPAFHRVCREVRSLVQEVIYGAVR